MRTISTIMALLAFVVALHAQGNASSVKEINKIKVNPDYITAESTVKDWETAYDNAKLLLIQEIEDWLISQGESNTSGVIAYSQDHIYEIKSTRGSLYRAFVYVEKSDILKYKDKSKLLVVDKTEQQADSVEIAPAIDKSSLISAAPSSTPLSSLEKKMLNVKTCVEIEQFIKAEKANGKIAEYGKYSEMPTDCLVYLFVYNRDLKVVSYMKVDKGNFINLNTGKKDSITDYKGCGGIWFQTK